MGRVVRTRTAKVDVLQIWNHIAEDSIEAADRLVEKFNEKLQLLADFPGLGPARPELGPALRSFPVDQYLLIYERRTKGKGITLLRVVHGARNLRRLFRRR
jgi:toxin ParE1/3/4